MSQTDEKEDRNEEPKEAPEESQTDDIQVENMRNLNGDNTK